MRGLAFKPRFGSFFQMSGLLLIKFSATFIRRANSNFRA